jgi:hypothetical protein
MLLEIGRERPLSSVASTCMKVKEGGCAGVGVPGGFGLQAWISAIYIATWTVHVGTQNIG